MVNCLFCSKKESFKSFFIYEFEYWYLEHAKDTSISGWLILVLRRHCESLHLLSEFEWNELSKAFRFICTALQEITNCKKEYIVQYAEGLQTQHIHFHIIPRYYDLADSLKGRNIFQAFGPNIENKITENELDEIISKLKLHFTNNQIFL